MANATIPMAGAAAVETQTTQVIVLFHSEMEKRLRSLVTQVSKEDAQRMASGTQFFRKLELNSLLIREKQQEQQQQQQ